MTFTLGDVAVLELPLIRGTGVPIVFSPSGVRNFLPAVCHGLSTLEELIFCSILSEHPSLPPQSRVVTSKYDAWI